MIDVVSRLRFLSKSLFFLRLGQITDLEIGSMKLNWIVIWKNFKWNRGNCIYIYIYILEEYFPSSFLKRFDSWTINKCRRKWNEEIDLEEFYKLRVFYDSWRSVLRGNLKEKKKRKKGKFESCRVFEIDRKYRSLPYRENYGPENWWNHAFQSFCARMF